MLAISETSLEALAGPYRARMIDRALAILRDACWTGRVDIRHLGIADEAGFRAVATRTIDDARAAGVETLGDLLFLAALKLHRTDETFGSPAGKFLQAALAAPDHPIGERLDAAWALLPKPTADRLLLGAA